MNRYQCPVCNAISDNKITDSCDECLPVFEEMMNKFTIQENIEWVFIYVAVVKNLLLKFIL